MATKVTTIRRVKLSRPAAIALAVLGVVLLVFAGCALLNRDAGAEPYRTEAVQRGELMRSVSASGTLQALVTVEVGSQISGQISEVRADFNDRVSRGQVLAVLDAQTYVSRAQQGRAEVASAVAARNQAQAQADVARAAYNRQRTLYDKGIVARAALETAEADWKAAQAAVASANARINQSQAALGSTQVDLSRTTIVSPIDGIVVDRQIEPGQTVAASLQAPVLFRIAQDLSRMEVKINVDEADIGQVKEGQEVRFTVDAFPDENFTGVVKQVRMQPTSEQNVVAYTVIAEAANPDSKLMPGMTANADIIIEQKRNVLKAPAAALRWSPPDKEAQAPAGFGRPRQQRQNRGAGGGQRIVEQLDLTAAQRKQVEPILAEARQKAQGASGADRRQAMRAAMQEALTRIEPLLKPEQKTRLVALRAQMASGGQRGGMSSGVVWVLRGGKPEPIAVRIGSTDGSFTEIVGPLKPGDKVVTGGGPRPKVKGASPFAGGQPARIRM